MPTNSHGVDGALAEVAERQEQREGRSLPAMAAEPAVLLTVREVARRMGVCPATIYRLCERGELAHVRVGAVLRIAPADFARYLEWPPSGDTSRKGLLKML